MRRRWMWVAAGLVIIAAPIAWYLGSPLFINRTVQEAFPMSKSATVPPDMTRAQVEETLAKAAAETKEMIEAAPAGGVVTLARGTFVDADDFHQGSGTALILQLGGERVLRLENFRVTNGPDLHVYLSAHPRPTNREEVHAGSSIGLGKLKGNIGAQNYAIPAMVDLAQIKSVVIYCRPFHVVFSTATLQPGP